MSSYKILIGGYDFEQKIHRGITFYGKALVKSLSENELYLLTSSKFVEEKELMYLNILKKLDDPESDLILSKKKLTEYFKFIIKNNKHLIYKNNKRNLKEKLQYLNYIDYFYNIPYLYDISGVHNKLFEKKPLDIKVSKEIDYLLLTSPMNIKSNIPVIQTLHDVIPLTCIEHPPMDSLKIFYYRVKNMIKYSEKIISVSNFSKEECIKIFPEAEDKIEVTHQPIPIYEEEEEIANDEIVQSSVLKKFKLKEDNYLFFIGMLERRKNIKLLIEAYLAVADKIKIPLVLAGALGYGKEEFISYLKDKKYKKKIIYLNYISNIEKLVLLKNARAFVFPSLNEGFGLPPLEAMKMKTPVLTSNVTALPEVCGEAALLINPYSLKELADGLIEISENNSLREELLKNAPKQVEKFSYDNFKAKINKVIDSI
jgi:glycosyltransferase involved in cell wall biosynthesis